MKHRTCICNGDTESCKAVDRAQCRSSTHISCSSSPFDIRISRRGKTGCIDARDLLIQGNLTPRQLLRVKDHILEHIMIPTEFKIRRADLPDVLVTEDRNQFREPCPTVDKIQLVGYHVLGSLNLWKQWSELGKENSAAKQKELKRIIPTAVTRSVAWYPFPEAMDYIAMLNTRERKILHGYTHNWDRVYNMVLRGESYRESRAFRAEFPRKSTNPKRDRDIIHILNSIQTLQGIIYGFTIPRDVTVFRGITGGKKQLHYPGDVFTLHSFVSTTLSLDTAGDFFNTHDLNGPMDDTCCMYSITIPRGFHALPLLGDVGDGKLTSTSVYNEREILIPWGCTFHVDAITEDEGAQMYECTLIKQPPITQKPFVHPVDVTGVPDIIDVKQLLEYDRNTILSGATQFMTNQHTTLTKVIERVKKDVADRTPVDFTNFIELCQPLFNILIEKWDNRLDIPGFTCTIDPRRSTVEWIRNSG
jgi:hypothetical protein